MSDKNKKSVNLGVIVGLLGFISGIALMFGDDWVTGLFGSIASAFVASLSYNRSQNSKELKK
tara:strand:+ start:9682 stop:9867 length:186 start_codon:yes stop_codon:yes gene_type:complete